MRHGRRHSLPLTLATPPPAASPRPSTFRALRTDACGSNGLGARLLRRVRLLRPRALFVVALGLCGLGLVLLLALILRRGLEGPEARRDALRLHRTVDVDALEVQLGAALDTEHWSGTFQGDVSESDVAQAMRLSRLQLPMRLTSSSSSRPTPTQVPTPATTTPTPRRISLHAAMPVGIEGPWAPIPSLELLDELQCRGWRQTARCDPRGRRTPAQDGDCSMRLHIRHSGYCELQHPRTLRLWRIFPLRCNSRFGERRMTCLELVRIVRYQLQADVFVPTVPINASIQRLAFLTENDLLPPTTMPIPTLVWTEIPEEEGARAGKEDESEDDNDAIQEELTQSIKVTTAPPPIVSFTRGIVIVVYDKLLLSAFASVRQLRSTGCQLPIELWYNRNETDPRHPLLLHLVQHHGAFLRELQDPRATKFYSKIYAVAYSAFDQVLLLDADNFVVRDPTPVLFDSAIFNATGAIFWPDFWRPDRTIFSGMQRGSVVWDVFGVPFVDQFEQESGQVLIDRRRHPRALQALLHYALTEPHYPATLDLVWGDKDLFRFAWMRTNSSFHLITRPPGSAGQLRADRDGAFCGQTMVQHDPNGTILFLHRNIDKLTPTRHQAIWTHIQQFRPGQDLRAYDVAGIVDKILFPQFRKCYGKRLHHHRHYTTRAIGEFPFAQIENELLASVRWGLKLLAVNATQDLNTRPV